MKFEIYTIFPQFFSIFDYSILGKAKEKNLWSLKTILLSRRDDDIPYGGGSGMIMRPDTFDRYQLKGKILYMSPRGKRIDKKLIDTLLNEETISIICCRYNGIDQRMLDKFAIEEISLGDFILSGGEIAAMALIEAIVRKIPGVLGNKYSLLNESFEQYLLSCDQYTRPLSWHQLKVPDILYSGHHKQIEEWKRTNSEDNTYKRRPDLWRKYIKYVKMKQIESDNK